MNNLFKSVGVWLVIALVLMAVFNKFNAVSPLQGGSSQMGYSQFLDEVKQGHITKVTIEEGRTRTLKAVTNDGKRIITYGPQDGKLVDDLLANHVQLDTKPDEEPSMFTGVLISWFPMLLLVGVWIFFMRQMQGGGKGGAFSFGKSRARMLDDSKERVTIAEVAGCDEAQEEV
ncbi:MAG: ATP-dependent metallopeptidase FtsH/Yme1/Tma family protein, partial [Gallionellaceae bacterium]|nr:ATP-dependent metallopeptidase FtsH/Yme1/Tma family protein [Gallionellaceae bacterium]